MKTRLMSPQFVSPVRSIVLSAASRIRPRDAGRVLLVALLTVAAVAVWPGSRSAQERAETVAVPKDSQWREAVTWEGRLSTPESDCQSDGLKLAPWGIYPSGGKGIVVWCVSQEVYPKLGAVPWELWKPVIPRSAEGYCHAWHDVGLLHEEPDGRFWCEETPGQQERLPGGSNADSA